MKINKKTKTDYRFSFDLVEAESVKSNLMYVSFLFNKKETDPKGSFRHSNSGPLGIRYEPPSLCIICVTSRLYKGDFLQKIHHFISFLFKKWMNKRYILMLSSDFKIVYDSIYSKVHIYLFASFLYHIYSLSIIFSQKNHPILILIKLPCYNSVN